MKTILPSILFALAAAGCATCPCNPAPEETMTLYQFSTETGTGGWEIQNDSVMGGVSQGSLDVNDDDKAVFSGAISLENNGGFSSFQREFPVTDVSAYRTLRLRLKGDGKRYQVRVESEPRARHGYAFDFPTSGEWQVIEIPFDQMYAIHHGDRLDLPNYPGETLAHIQILAGDGRAETFRLELDRIWVQ